MKKTGNFGECGCGRYVARRPFGGSWFLGDAYRRFRLARLLSPASDIVFPMDGPIGRTGRSLLVPFN